MITTVYAPDLYVSNGTQTTYNITFKYMSNPNFIKVSVTDADDEVVALIRGVDYEVVNNTIVLYEEAVPTTGLDIAIELEPSYFQETEFSESTFPTANAIENVLDRLTLSTNYLAEVASRGLSVSILDDAGSSFGTMSTQDADAVAITGGSISGITDLPVASGGTGASTAANARTNLGTGTIATQNSNNVSITGGTLTATTIDIIGTTTDGSPDATVDYTLTYDASAGVNKKVLLDDLPSGTANLSLDTTPQLGGNLDLNGFGIEFPSVTITDIKDQDNMSSDSATSLVTQQSAKAYVDNELNTLLIKEILTCSEGGNFQSGQTHYKGLNSNKSLTELSSPTNAQLDAIAYRVPYPGTISRLFVTVASAASPTVTLYKNRSATALTVTQTNSGDGAVSSNTSDTISVTTGDLLYLQFEESSGSVGECLATVIYTRTYP